MFLLLDANVIVGNPLLRGRLWDAVADAVVSDALDLYVSELAVEEVSARYRDAAAVRERTLEKNLKSWPPESRALITNAIKASRDFAAGYEQLLRDRLEEMGAEVVDYPEVDHRDIARRAIARTAPFDGEGNGYRDALHWYTFVDLLLTKEPEDPYAFLMSGDKRAFGPRRHAELLAEVEELDAGWEVGFLQSISEFEVPGQFLDEDGDLGNAQESQLFAAINDALQAGGMPKDFTHVLADRASFDAAEISEVLSMDVIVDRVQIERRSGDLWINYSAQATCLIELESLEVVNENDREYATIRDSAVWNLSLSGNAYSSGEDVNEVASLRLVAIDGEPELHEP